MDGLPPKRSGRLRFGGDWADYIDWTLERCAARPADHITTRQEEKRLGDIAPVWLAFERV